MIASGMMAGAAIFGIISAVLRLPQVGAPIRGMSVGVDFFYETSKAGNVLLKHEAQGWYSGFDGQLLSVVMFALLGVACYLLARKGAQWELSEGGGAPPAATEEREEPAGDGEQGEDEDDQCDGGWFHGWPP